jgi:hypothetical protein
MFNDNENNNMVTVRSILDLIKQVEEAVHVAWRRKCDVAGYHKYVYHTQFFSCIVKHQRGKVVILTVQNERSYKPENFDISCTNQIYVIHSDKCRPIQTARYCYVEFTEET